jgi:HSP20 family protein
MQIKRGEHGGAMLLHSIQLQREKTMASNLSRFTPFGDLARFDPFRDIERFFDEFERHSMQPDLARGMRMDVSETDQAYTVRAEMPGFEKEDINVSIDGKTVTIRAKHDEQKQPPQTGTLMRGERFHGEHYRSFTLPQEVDDQQASATCVNGVLELTLPKKTGGHGRQLQVQ